ncbi:MAG: hypothetical protein DMD86_16625 [Candidatus Rokuibacteriota bacterium]|nr:MAG: hypothetical protein DMD86_16625 [Candidatus Rokubacteria bacterium]
MAWSGCGAPSARARWQRRARSRWLAWSDSGGRRSMETQTAVTVARATTRAASRSRGRRLTSGTPPGSGDLDAPTDASPRRRGAAGSRRSPPAGRSCRGESPLAETGERSIEPRLTARELYHHGRAGSLGSRTHRVTRMHETEFHRLIALAVFVGTYVGLGIGRLPPFRVDRTGVAIIGAAVMVVTGVIPWDAAVAAVDAHTLVLLFGMMIVAAYLRLSGFFRLVTELAVRRARTPVGLLGMIIVAAGGLSALFVKPVIPTFGEPTRGWLLLAMASTLAGNLTILGSVANLIVVEEARAGGVPISFLEYSKVGAPVTLGTLLVGWLILTLVPV